MAPRGLPSRQEDVIEEQEGKGLSARPCLGPPCGARGPGSVPALTSIEAQMDRHAQLSPVLIPEWESMAEQNLESESLLIIVTSYSLVRKYMRSKHNL